MVALQSLSDSVADEPISVDLVSIEWSEQYGGWLVIWAGYLHGGVHLSGPDGGRSDAELHAAALLEDPDWENWLAMNQYGAEVQS